MPDFVVRLLAPFVSDLKAVATELGAPTNLELLVEARQIAHDAGRPLATAAQAREILGLS